MTKLLHDASLRREALRLLLLLPLGGVTAGYLFLLPWEYFLKRSLLGTFTPWVQVALPAAACLFFLLLGEGVLLQRKQAQEVPRGDLQALFEES